MARITLAVKAATDLGLKRSQNEDSHTVWLPDDPAERERRGALIIVADGMGGSLAGEVASHLAVDTVLRCYRDAEGDDTAENLREAVEAANEAVHNESLTHPDLSGMGTTCTVLVVRDRSAFLAHVGDSRAYLVRNGSIQQVTRDHSLVAQLVQRNQITPEEARVDPRRNVVTRSVGVSAAVEVDVEQVDGPLSAGDTFLLCSDGLHGLVSDPELAAGASSPDLEQACKDLIALANERGGNDNITVVLARVQELDETLEMEPARETSPHSTDESLPAVPPGARRRMMMWLIIALVMLLGVLALMFWLAGRLGEETDQLDRAARVESSDEGAAWL